MTGNPLSTMMVLSPAEVVKAAPLVGANAVMFLKISPVLFSQVFWLSPLPTTRHMQKVESTEGIPPVPYFSMMANGWLWVCYGYTADLDLTIMTPNATGFLAGAYYTSIYMKYDSKQYNVAPVAAVSAGLMATSAGLALGMDSATAQPILGAIGFGIVVAMFSGPLAVIKEVIQTGSTKNLPAPMAVATVINCALWGSYGSLVTHDFWIWCPNGLGFVSGVVQCGLLARYGIHKEDSELHAPATPEVVKAADQDPKP